MFGQYLTIWDNCCQISFNICQYTVLRTYRVKMTYSKQVLNKPFIKIYYIEIPNRVRGFPIEMLRNYAMLFPRAHA